MAVRDGGGMSSPLSLAAFEALHFNGSTREARPILAIDPGPKFSAFVLFRNGQPEDFAKVESASLLRALRLGAFFDRTNMVVACEQVRGMGMAIGAEVLDTVEWSGRFHEACDRGGYGPWLYVPRLKVKVHLCGSARAKDGNIIQALKDRFGGKGTKAAPGPLYGFKADAWQALALAITVADGAA